MLDIFATVLGSSITLSGFAVCTAASLLLGALIAVFFTYREPMSRGFKVTLALLPAVVQLVIMLVNGNIGAGVAVAGAFSLVRFRSANGTAKEIASIFFAMAVGLATGMGYVAIAAVFTVILILCNALYTAIGFGKEKGETKFLKITIPEDLDYSGVFDDLFDKYLSRTDLVKVKTSNMGTMYKLTYEVALKNNISEKEMIDALRCRNGNLEISCEKKPLASEL